MKPPTNGMFSILLSTNAKHEISNKANVMKDKYACSKIKKKRLDTKNDIVSALWKKIQSLQAKTQSFQKINARKNGAIKELQAKLFKLEQINEERDELSREIDGNAQNAKTKDCQINELKFAVTEIKELCQRYMAEIGDLKQQQKNDVNLIKELREVISEKQRITEQNEFDLNTLRECNHVNELEMQSMKARISSILEKEDELISSNELLQNDIITAEKSKQAQREDMEALNQKLVALKQDFENKQTETIRLQLSNEDQRGRIELLQNENKQSLKSINEQEESIKQLKEEHIANVEELKHKEEFIVDITKKLTDSEAGRQQNVANLREAQDNNSELISLVDTLRRETIKIKQRHTETLSQKDEERDGLMIKIQDFETDIGKCRAVLQSQIEEIASLKIQQTTSKQRDTDQIAEIKRYKQEIKECGDDMHKHNVTAIYKETIIQNQRRKMRKIDESMENLRIKLKESHSLRQELINRNKQQLALKNIKLAASENIIKCKNERIAQMKGALDEMQKRQIEAIKLYDVESKALTEYKLKCDALYNLNEQNQIGISGKNDEISELMKHNVQMSLSVTDCKQKYKKMSKLNEEYIAQINELNEILSSQDDKIRTIQKKTINETVLRDSRGREALIAQVV